MLEIQPEGGRRFLAAALFVLALGCVLQAAWGYSYSDQSGHAAGTDDAYVSYRYAFNLLANTRSHPPVGELAGATTPTLR